MTQDNNIAAALRAHLDRYAWDKSLNKSEVNTPVGVDHCLNNFKEPNYDNDSNRKT